VAGLTLREHEDTIPTYILFCASAVHWLTCRSDVISHVDFRDLESRSTGGNTLGWYARQESAVIQSDTAGACEPSTICRSKTWDVYTHAQAKWHIRG